MSFKHLRYFDDLSYDEISAITNSSVGTLKTNYHYAFSAEQASLLTRVIFLGVRAEAVCDFECLRGAEIVTGVKICCTLPALTNS